MTPSLPNAPRIEIQTTTDAAIIHQLAHATWYPTYQNILAKEQIEFMLAQVYSLEALEKQMAEGQTFLLLRAEGEPAAFAAYSCLNPATHLYKLNKLYIHPAFQGHGFGKRLLQEVTQRVKDLGGAELELNVHRENPAQHFYLKHGFKISQIVDLPFAQFMLNDYIMHLNLLSPK
ncbi:GNAT family N-acetyltransferase [Rufibacter glacialis]|uniref:GNAT family N-acetyltransferase n=1 Tax=Rufibacter glacialis TaxID=1259555 RepID=A0A5M8QL14_9BACT|nr:GNAT family N-acetyltransferase [Rufibacter glacialis]KAA6435841.1 GNAT family N-acetyltransferase [Rufibacter glacialis]GGK67019.1 hypothetical protein GCM10011405_13730 [Rufibacter glacialis]